MNTTNGPLGLPRVYRARNLLIWSTGFSVLIVIAALAGWFAFDPEIRAMFTWFQIGTLIIIGGVLIGFMMGLGLSIVRADSDGILIRNALSVRRIAWSDIAGFQYRQGDPWAFVVLTSADEGLPAGAPVHHDDMVRRQMIGIQTTDGGRSRQAVRELREFHARFTGG